MRTDSEIDEIFNSDSEETEHNVEQLNHLNEWLHSFNNLLRYSSDHILVRIKMDNPVKINQHYLYPVYMKKKMIEKEIEVRSQNLPEKDTTLFVGIMLTTVIPLAITVIILLIMLLSDPAAAP